MNPELPDSRPELSWTSLDGSACHARWHSERGTPPPKRVQVIDDRMNADAAYRLVCEGTALLWQGDYHNGRALLQALERRINRSAVRKKKPSSGGHVASLRDAFNLYRMAQSQRANLLGRLLVAFADDYRLPLRRAPDLRDACLSAYGPALAPFVVSLRELLGVISAFEWQRKGVAVSALGGARIHPHYGVFSPLRGEYVDLLASAPLPSNQLAFDIGTGTGVLAAVLAQRGVQRIVATDTSLRALNCARENLAGLGCAARVELQHTDLFPPGRAPLIVCNPPWLPARAHTSLEQAVYDPDSGMLRRFLAGVRDHLEAPAGEAWLILSDLAEHIGLRSRQQLLDWIDASGLEVRARIDTRPTHSRPRDPNDPLHAARAAEITSLWRLGLIQ